MLLDEESCYRALMSRDARFDGRFFAAVRTTGIYCRPICPARKPRRENVRYYPTAAAAEAAGYRACRRCRPDAAPGSPEWRGSAALVARAVRLVHAGALDEAGVGELAARLGVSARHLARLFRAELGCAPLELAQTVRAHLARALIDESELPLTRIAFAAGYGSVRRFNAEMRARFGRAPGELRRRRWQGADAGGWSLRLAYRPPFDWEALRGWLGARAIDGLERIDGERYVRTVLHEGRAGWVALEPAKGERALRFTSSLPATRGLVGLVERARSLCDLRADPERVERHLARDPELRARLARHPGLRVPGAWDGFELAVRAVVGQQVSVPGARTLLGRLVARHGAPVETGRAGLTRLFPAPEAIAEGGLGGLGLTSSRAAALRALARAVVSGALDLSPAADPDEARGRLLALPGFGRWTAEYVALRALRDPDAFPAGDLGLRRALANGAGPLPERELERRAEAWRPWRGYAAMLLWSTAAPRAKLEVSA
jgi:AraC family transcriptional regulator of adaptative response / DNA-3-methyladenine glycosylase II